MKTLINIGTTLLGLVGGYILAWAFGWIPALVIIGLAAIVVGVVKKKKRKVIPSKEV